MSPVKLVELLQQVLLQRLRELLNELPRIVTVPFGWSAIRTGGRLPTLVGGPTPGIQSLADLDQLSRNYRTSHFAVPAISPPDLLQSHQLPTLADLHPALYQKLRVESSPSLSIQLFELLPDPYGYVSPHLFIALAVDCAIGTIQRRVQTLKAVDRPVEILAQGVQRLCMLQLRATNSRQKLGLVGFEVSREGRKTGEGMFKGANERLGIKGDLRRRSRSAIDGYGTLGERFDKVLDNEILALFRVPWSAYELELSVRTTY